MATAQIYKCVFVTPAAKREEELKLMSEEMA
jgi:hypothetical protein